MYREQLKLAVYEFYKLINIIRIARQRSGITADKVLTIIV
jgi:hypothetical protein